MKLKIGDEILVTIGKDKGRKGKIEKVFPKTDSIFVPGINVYKRSKRASTGQKGSIIEFSRPLPYSKIALVCPHCNKQTRIGYMALKDGEKVRICKKCKRQVDQKKGEK